MLPFKCFLIPPFEASRGISLVCVLGLALGAFLTSSGCHRQQAGDAGVSRDQSAQDRQAASGAQPAGDSDRGRAIFDNKCSFCHYADREQSKLGPGLMGILKKESLPVSGRPATRANVISQLKTPIGTMPSFASLSDQEIADLLAYLETL
jgi:mono/diheme cytochrome c family protein